MVAKTKKGLFVVFVFFLVGFLTLSMCWVKPVRHNASAESSVDISKFPTANVLPYPYVDGNEKTTNGITFTVNGDGSISMNGTSTDYAYFYINTRLVDYLIDGQDYAISLQGNVDTYYLQFYFRDDQNVLQGAFSSYSETVNKFTYTSEWVGAEVYLFVRSGVTVDNVIFYPSLNRGSVVYDYFPPYDLLYQALKDEGYNEGYQSGQEQGYYDALTSFRRGIFNDLQVQAEYNYGGQYNTRNENVPYTYGTDYVNFADFYESIKQRNGIDLSYIKLTFVFSGDYLYYYYPLYVYGAFVNGTVYGSNGAFNFDTGLPDGVGTNMAKDDIIEIIPNTPETIPADNFIYSYIEMTLYTARDLADFRLISPSGNYNVGYQVGYENGKEDGLYLGNVNEYNRGRKDGLLEGEVIGYESGYQEGLKTANNGSLVNMLGAIADVPVSVISDFLNFELLGLNMLSFFAGIVTLLLIVKVIKIFI